LISTSTTDDRRTGSIGLSEATTQEDGGGNERDRIAAEVGRGKIVRRLGAAAGHFISAAARPVASLISQKFVVPSSAPASDGERGQVFNGTATAAATGCPAAGRATGGAARTRRFCSARGA
jgi:hypothetical protein